MSQQTKPESTETINTNNTEEQLDQHQPSSNVPVANLKIEQVEDRANPAKPIIFC